MYRNPRSFEVKIIINPSRQEVLIICHHRLKGPDCVQKFFIGGDIKLIIGAHTRAGKDPDSPIKRVGIIPGIFQGLP